MSNVVSAFNVDSYLFNVTRDIKHAPVRALTHKLYSYPTLYHLPMYS